MIFTRVKARTSGKHYNLIIVVLLLGGLLMAANQASTAQAAPFGGRTPGAVAAFYYPWYDIDGNINVWQRDAGKMVSQPATLYHSGDINTMRNQMQQARDAGIDAFAVTYNATPGSWRDRFNALLNNAPLGFSIAAHFEVSLMRDQDKNVNGVVNALRELRNGAMNHPNYFRYQGRPVIYFWWPQGIPGDVRANWTNIRNQVDPNHETIWSVDTTDFGLLDVFDTVHYFSGAKWADNPQGTFADAKNKVNAWNASHGGPRRLSTSSVTPGYDDRRFRSPGEFRDRAGGNYYQTSWNAAIATQPDLVTISTWNEWYEGSAIEPGRDWGNTYLDITRAKTGAFKGTATPFSDASILKTWRRPDLPVANHNTDRSWMWGPGMFDLRREQYANSPGGSRMVYYFDKSRMEINHPGGPPDVNDLFYVTNGLLPIELMSGKIKTGDYQDTPSPKGPAQIPVAGDSQNNPNTPTYAAMAHVSTLNGDNRSGDRTGQTVTQTLAANGNVGNNPGFTGRGVKLVKYIPESGHNIAGPFWDFMQRSGAVWEDSGLRNAQVVDWLFAMGYPISEAYWTRAKVGGVERDVLVQAFERRVLTYTPDNPDAFKVEMGNVGQHYHLWRYGN
ncbi:MAG TPA: glycoside hydrolase family 99-like domain-containing protein [Chloroflexia bacterium]|nr:glycoside hydrolase family 99-like domain-containing protein [Chloroflexia bacterium]